MSSNIRASLYMTLSMFGFSVNDMFVKGLGETYSVEQIVWLRGVMVTTIIFALLWHRGELRHVGVIRSPRILIRGVLEIGATLTFLWALVQLPFANVLAIMQAIPLIVTLGAVVVFGEVVGWRRWIAIVLGLFGVLLIIRPGMDGFESASLLVVVAVLFASARDLITRSMSSSIPSLVITSATALLVMLGGMGATLISGSWQPISMQALLILLVASLNLFLGYHFIVLAMRTGDTAYTVPYRYTSLLWAVLFGYFVFGEILDSWTIVGSLLIVGSGLFTLYREMRIRSDLPAQSGN